MKIEGVGMNMHLTVRPIKPVQPRPSDPQVELARQQQQLGHSNYDTTSSQQPAGQKIEPEAVQQAVQDVNKSLHLLNERLEFDVHDATNRVIVRVLDRETDEVIKEIPPEQFLDILSKLQELVGVFIDRKA